MLIKDIFDSPIERNINPAVVVGDNSEEIVRAEIDEYVFTPALAENLYTLLRAIAEKNVGKTGIWINGYYGSGKSHFLKYAHYCMSPRYSEAAFGHFEDAIGKLDMSLSDVTASNIRALRKKLSDAVIENILFNVEAVTGDNKTERLTRIFLNQLNAHRGYNATDIPLANLLEKELDRAGVFEEFKDRLRKENYDWDNKAAAVARLYLDHTLDVAGELMPGLSKDALRAALKNKEMYQVSINDTLIPELEEYIADKGPNFRLVFLVDEISQYVGNNKEILLNLQTIVEALGQKLKHKVWVVCTAQQNLEEVVGKMDSADRQDEFGKILGRFDTRINLESNDPAYITQKRVLEKNADGLHTLQGMYRKHKDAIDHQFHIGSDLYKGFSSEEDFTQAYPFVPYQFKLIADVFHSFQQQRYVVTEVKDSARSVIGITHFTVKEVKDQPVGGFIPFDSFYNGMLETNLQHAGRRVIDRALGQQFVQENPFAQRVARLLFMVAHLSEECRRLVPSNIETLTVLMMTDIGQNKLELRQKITDVLQRLKEANIIREEEGRFLFYNEDEVAVTNIISSQNITSDERTRTVYRELLTRVLDTASKKMRVGQTDFSIGFDVDGQPYQHGDVRVNITAFDGTPLPALAMASGSDALVIGLSDILLKDKQLQEDLLWFCRVEHYLTHQGAGAIGDRDKTNRNFRDRNNLLKDSLIRRLKEAFLKASAISQQQINLATAFKGAEPKSRFQDMLEKHILGVNRYLMQADGYAADEETLRKEARDAAPVLHKELTEAERQVNDAISRAGDKTDVDKLIQTFTATPFSWRFQQVLSILLALQKKGVREFEFQNEPRYPNADFIEKAIKTPNRAACIVRSTEAITTQEVEAARNAFNLIFNDSVPYTTDGVTLFNDLKQRIQANAATCARLLEQYPAAPFTESIRQYDKLLQGWAAVRNPKPFLDAIVADTETTRQRHDDFTELQSFLHTNGAAYAAILKFAADNADNFSRLTAEDADRAARIAAYPQSDKPQEGFRHIKKAVEEVGQKLKATLAALKETTCARYAEEFETLRAQADKLGVEAGGVLPEESTLLDRIRHMDNIGAVQLELARATDFRSDYLARLFNRRDEQQAAKEAAKGSTKTPSPVQEPVEFYISRITPTISDEEELNTFLSTLKIKMMEMLRKNQTIIIRE